MRNRFLRLICAVAFITVLWTETWHDDVRVRAEQSAPAIDPTTDRGCTDMPTGAATTLRTRTAPETALGIPADRQ